MDGRRAVFHRLDRAVDWVSGRRHRIAPIPHCVYGGVEIVFAVYEQNVAGPIPPCRIALVKLLV